jgi:hypothetical protein
MDIGDILNDHRHYEPIREEIPGGPTTLRSVEIAASNKLYGADDANMMVLRLIEIINGLRDSSNHYKDQSQ